MPTLDAQLTILLQHDVISTLSSHKLLLSMFALITGVTYARLAEVFRRSQDADWQVHLVAHWSQDTADLTDAPVENGHTGVPPAEWEGSGESLSSFMAPDGVSMVMIPLVIDERWWGFVRLEDPQKDRLWEPAEITALEQVAQQIGMGIRQQHLAST